MFSFFPSKLSSVSCKYFYEDTLTKCFKFTRYPINKYYIYIKKNDLIKTTISPLPPPSFRPCKPNIESSIEHYRTVAVMFVFKKRFP